jgi:proline iminopeptidase
MLLVSVTSSRRLELDWLYRGAGRFYPEAWARFRDYPGVAGYRLPTDTEPPIEDLLLAYSALMESPDRAVRERTALEWVTWEDAVISGESSGSPGSYSSRVGDARLAFVRICAHYFAHDGFLCDNELIRNAGVLRGIPGVLVHGRNDIGGPVVTAWEIAAAWPDAELIVIDDSGHTGNAAMSAVLDEVAERLSERAFG